MSQVGIPSDIEEAVEEEYRDIFAASNIAEKLDDSSSKEVTNSLSKMAASEDYEIQRLEGLPKAFSSVGEINVTSEIYRHIGVYQKAIQVVKGVREHKKESYEVSIDEIRMLTSHYSDLNSISAITEQKGIVSDNLKRHPQIEYDELEETYRWKK